MKATQKLLAAFFALAFVAGQHLTAQTIKTPAFAQPIVEQWIMLYNHANPDAQVSIASKGSKSDIEVVVSHQQQEQLGQTTSVFGRYAILPFAAQGSEAAQTFGSKKLSKSKLAHIFFEVDEEEDEYGDYADANKGMTIYSGNSQSSVSTSFAEFFGQNTTNFRGKRIQGDDRFVNLAVSRDQKGLSFNALSNLFNLETRRLREGIQVLELDARKRVQEAIADGDLDELIASLEEKESNTIATIDISLGYNRNDANVVNFVNWVLSEGISYNHQFGLLNATDLQLQANR